LRRSERSATGSSLSNPHSKGRSRPGAASLSDELVAKARARLRRLTAAEAAAAQARGDLLVDIRTAAQRLHDGDIPGAVVIERTVLEWRLDPTSPWRIAEATGADLRVVVICAEGYSSSLAAASLQDLGLRNATDVIDGFDGWRSAGLAIER